MVLDYHKMPVKAKVSQPTRALDTVYQNTTGRPLLCLVTVIHERASVLNGGATITVKVDSSSPPATSVAFEGLRQMDNNEERFFGFIAFTVPNGYYYKVVSNAYGVGSSNTLSRWVEIEL